MSFSSGSSSSGSRSLRFIPANLSESGKSLEDLEDQLQGCIQGLRQGRRKRSIRDSATSWRFHYDSKTGKRLRTTPASKNPRPSKGHVPSPIAGHHDSDDMSSFIEPLAGV